MPLVNVNGIMVDVPVGYHYIFNGMATPQLVPDNAPPPNQPPPAAPGTPPAPIPQPITYPITSTQLAWQNSQQALQSRRKQLFQQYGLTEKGTIDPNNQFGQARSLLGRYGQQLELARMANAGRGIGTHGLSQQRERLIRYALGAASYGMTTDFLGRVANIDLDLSKLGPKPVI